MATGIVPTIFDLIVGLGRTAALSGNNSVATIPCVGLCNTISTGTGSGAGSGIGGSSSTGKIPRIPSSYKIVRREVALITYV